MSQKMIGMPDFKLMQLRYESETWKRSLEFMMNENVQFKYRLSDVLKNNVDKRRLNQLEEFQTSFIKEDDLINVLRNDVAELEKSLVCATFEDDQLMKQVELKMKTIRNDIHNAEKMFGKLKSAFIVYLTKKM